MEKDYPNPCYKCDKAKTCRTQHGCIDWEIRYRYRQKQINAFADRLKRRKKFAREKFTYMHPDEARRYLKEGPCKSCKADSVCDTPCPAYLRWWDARMRLWSKVYEISN